MNTSIKTELLSCIIETAQCRYTADSTDFEELQFYAFNEDYYIVGYYQAEQWLKKHDVNPFEAIADVTEVLGEVTLTAKDLNAEKLVNLYVYVKGDELIQDALSAVDLNDTTQQEVLDALRG